MMSKTLTIFLIATLLMAGASAGVNFCSNYYKQKAIEHKAAYYHPDTGEFTWREKK